MVGAVVGMPTVGAVVGVTVGAVVEGFWPPLPFPLPLPLPLLSQVPPTRACAQVGVTGSVGGGGGVTGLTPLPNLAGSPVSTRFGKSWFFQPIFSAAVSRKSRQMRDGVPAPNIAWPVTGSISGTRLSLPPTQTVAASCGMPPTNQQSPEPPSLPLAVVYSQVPDLATLSRPPSRSRWSAMTTFCSTPSRFAIWSASKTRVPPAFSGFRYEVLPVSGSTRLTCSTKCAGWCTPPATMVATPSACSSGTTRYWPNATSVSK